MTDSLCSWRNGTCMLLVRWRSRMGTSSTRMHPTIPIHTMLFVLNICTSSCDANLSRERFVHFGRIFSARWNTVNWLDKAHSSVFFLSRCIVWCHMHTCSLIQLQLAIEVRIRMFKKNSEDCRMYNYARLACLFTPKTTEWNWVGPL